MQTCYWKLQNNEQANSRTSSNKTDLQIQSESNVALDAGKIGVVHPHGATGAHPVNQHVLTY